MSKNNSALLRIVMLLVVASFTFSANAGTPIPVSQVSGGGYYQRLVARNGNVYSTGMSNYSGVANDSYNPYWFKHVSDGDMFPQSTYLANITSIESGSVFAIALDANGFCWSWGYNYGYGSLGNGEPSSTKSEPVQVKGENGIGVLSHITAISASKSGFFSLVVDSNGWTYGWGDNSKYQLAKGIGGSYTSPILINGLLKIKAVATGLQTSYAVDVNGFLWSFGSNQYGALGINSTNQGLNQYRPQEVNEITGQGRLHHIKAVASGWNHCLALEDMNNPNDPNVAGRVFAFGRNDNGQCGDNSSSNNRLYPVLVRAGEQDPNNQDAPLKNIKAIACGLSHSVFLDSAGNVFCVGRGDVASLGNGSLAKSTRPVKVRGYKGKGYLSNIVAVSASPVGSFAVDSNGTLWAWGQNNYDFLGLVASGNRPTPEPVPLYDPNLATDIWNATKRLPYQTINAAVSDANSNGNDVIILGRRIYNEAVTLDNTKHHLTIQGSNPNDDIAVAHTIIGGNAVSNSITCTANNGSVIKGLHFIPVGSYAINSTNSSVTIERCMSSASYGIYGQQSSNLNIICCTTRFGRYGIYCDNSSATVTSSTIGPGHYIGIYAVSSDIDVNNCLIGNNTGSGCIGVSFSTNSSGSIVNSTILNNTTGISAGSNSFFTVSDCNIQQNPAGGIYADLATAVIENCLIENNRGDGIRINNTAATVTNSVICKNNNNGFYSSQDKGSLLQNNWLVKNGDSSSEYGIYLSSSTVAPLIIGNTISKNYFGGVYRTGGSDPNIVNCIVYSNTTTSANNLAGTFNHVFYSCIGTDTYGGAYNISDDPSFAATDANNFHLLPDSACIGMGDPNRTYSDQTDIDGDARVVNNIIDIGADEWYHNNADFDNDNIVNFVDYSLFAAHWKQTNANPNWSSTFDLHTDNVIDDLDLMYFADSWLWQAPWSSTGGGIMGMSAMFGENMEDEGEPNDPNEEPIDPNTIFFLVESPHCGVCDSVEPNYPPQEPNDPNQGGGEPVVYLVYDGNMIPDPNEDVTVYVHSDVPLYSMEVYAAVTGDANITSAMSTADCNQYGWDPQYSSDPYIDPSGWVYINGGKWGINSDTTIGYFKFIYHSGQVDVAITTDSAAYDANSQPVTFSTDAIVFGGESMQGGQQQSIMQRSSSFQLESSSLNEQQVVDINELANWAEQLWLEDAELRATTTEAEWQAFIDSIRYGQ